MNDPINFIDPSGEIAISLTVAGIAVIVVATGAILYVYYTQVMPTLIDSTSSSRSATTTTSSRGRDLASGVNSADVSPQSSNNPSEINDIDPNNLPQGWTSRTDNGGRIHIRDAQGNYRIRIDPANPKKGTEAHRHHHDENENPINIDGNPTRFGNPDSHIPIDRDGRVVR